MILSLVCRPHGAALERLMVRLAEWAVAVAERLLRVGDPGDLWVEFTSAEELAAGGAR